ncbi:hypothetical protein LCGC14_0401280 [marine sediment metagenome]|uniref:Uncharacterized protein n=1 Tax=marine sediment metagenome TaxID=412755 RepID=A0A0F9SWZ6_9ZZZZ
MSESAGLIFLRRIERRAQKSGGSIELGTGDLNLIIRDFAALEAKLDECETEIQRLPLPPIELGDGPTERVSNILTKLKALVEQGTSICGNASEVGADPDHYQIPKEYVNAMYGQLQEFEIAAR